jgi:hypothetical protein
MDADVERRKKILRNRLRHQLHPLTIYCRLKDLGLKEDNWVKHICVLYETRIWVWLKHIIQALPERRR